MTGRSPTRSEIKYSFQGAGVGNAEQTGRAKKLHVQSVGIWKNTTVHSREWTAGHRDTGPVLVTWGMRPENSRFIDTQECTGSLPPTCGPPLMGWGPQWGKGSKGVTWRNLCDFSHRQISRVNSHHHVPPSSSLVSLTLSNPSSWIKVPDRGRTLPGSPSSLYSQ